MKRRYEFGTLDTVIHVVYCMLLQVSTPPVLTIKCPGLSSLR